MQPENSELIDKLLVRQATKADVANLEWGGELIHFRNLFNDAYKNVENGVGQIWVAELKSHGLVGQAIISLASNRLDLSDGSERAYLYGFRVMPGFRNRGIGTWMMQFLESDLCNRGFKKVTLNVARENVKALRLYSRLGYKVIGTDPGDWSFIDHEGFQRMVHEPAWRMQKELRKT